MFTSVEDPLSSLKLRVLTNFLEVMTWNSRQHGVSRPTRLVRIKYRFFKFSAKQKGSSGCPGNASSDDQVRIGEKIRSERRSAYIFRRRRYLHFLSAQTFYMSAPLKCSSCQHLLPEDTFLFLN
jgi:hypothetical protein